MKFLNLMTAGVVACALTLSLAACTVQEDTAVGVLTAQGYSQIELGGPAFFGCSDDDELTRTFKARGVDGQGVEGVVCSGLFFKGATVRLTGFTR